MGTDIFQTLHNRAVGVVVLWRHSPSKPFHHRAGPFPGEHQIPELVSQ